MRPASGDHTHGPRSRPFVQVLADRMAVTISRREPGYPLPRRTALARRFRATEAEIDAAIEELIRRQLLRRLPTGEVHRTGPAEYLVSLEGLPGLSSVIDPMDHAVSCASVRVSRLRAPAEVADVLGLVPGSPVGVRRCLWTADGEPAAASATYVLDARASLLNSARSGGPADARSGGPADPGEASPAGRPAPPQPGPAESAGTAKGGLPTLAQALDLPGWPDDLHARLIIGAVRIEVQPPPRSVARRLRLATGAPAVMVTVRLDEVDGANGAPQPAGAQEPTGSSERRRGSQPTALTVLALRPELFRVVLETRRLPEWQAAGLTPDGGEWSIGSNTCPVI